MTISTKKALTLALLITAAAPCNANIFSSMWKIASGLGGIGRSFAKSKPLFWGTLGFGLGKSWPYLAQQPEDRAPITDFSCSYMLPVASIKNVGINTWGICNEGFNLCLNAADRLLEDNK